MAIKKTTKKSSGNSETRTRNWTFVLYPESAPENWRELLDEYHIEWVESPLHDSDINANGEKKKAHIHIGLFFAGNKTYEQVKSITDKLNCPIPERCHSMRALVRYMAHLDNPEKAQYKASDIIGHGGVDVAELLRPSSSERYTLISDMVKYVQKHNITEFHQLVDYAVVEHFDDWFPLLCDSCAFVMGQYIKSQRHSRKAVSEALDNGSVDESTGEVKTK